MTPTGENHQIQTLLSNLTPIRLVLCDRINTRSLGPDAFLSCSVLFVCLHFSPLWCHKNSNPTNSKGETASRAPPCAAAADPSDPDPGSKPPLHPQLSLSLNYYSCPVCNHCRWQFTPLWLYFSGFFRSWTTWKDQPQIRDVGGV